MKKNFKGKGSKPITGNISDNQIHLILEIPKTTLRDWKNSDGYRKKLYWLLKSMKKEELVAYKEKSQEYIIYK